MLPDVMISATGGQKSATRAEGSTKHLSLARANLLVEFMRLWTAIEEELVNKRNRQS